MPPTRSWKWLRLKRWSISSGLLVLAGLITFLFLCSFITNQSQASPFNPRPAGAPVGRFPFPEVTPGPTPTLAATRTVSRLPAAAVIPTEEPVSDSPVTTTGLTSTVSLTQPQQVEHVVIISIDGLRPDALFLAITPNIDKLIAQGSYSPSAQSLPLSITLPNHASMLSGMVAAKHGIQWGVPYIGWPGMTGPTLFNVAHKAGLSTGMIAGKNKMNYLVIGNSVDKLFVTDVHDPEIRDKALEFIQAGLPEVLFVHFPDTDRVGHAYGWLSENQFQSITFADGLVGEIVAELERSDYLARTLLIITSDHGGHGFSHGDDCPEDRTIPWLAVGPGAPPGVTLHRPINTYDTAATAAAALNLPIPENWDGRPVVEVLEGMQ